MRHLLALLFALVCVLPAKAESLNRSPTGGPAASTCNDAAPAPAAAVGFNTETFCTNTFTTANTDTTGGLNPGFAWYTLNCFGSHFSKPTPAYVLNGDGSITLGTSSGGPALMWSVHCITGAPYWRGTAYGGGMYWEATVQFPHSANSGNPFPSMWMQAAESFSNPGGLNPASQWPGQADGYDHFEEVDLIEYMGGTLTTDRCSHDWYGPHGSGFSWANEFSSCDYPTQTLAYFSSPHTYGILWVPATASTNGKLVWYVDGAVVKTLTWAQFIPTNCQSRSTQCPPPIGSTNWSPGKIDYDHMVLTFDGSGTVPNTISNVHVFQASAVNNVSY